MENISMIQIICEFFNKISDFTKSEKRFIFAPYKLILFRAKLYWENLQDKWSYMIIIYVKAVKAGGKKLDRKG